jgi:hypothetical protein
VGEPPGGQRRPDRLRQDLAVDDARDGGVRERVAERVDRHVAQALRRLILAVHLVGEGRSEGLGVGERHLVQCKCAALHDRPLAESARAL